MKDILGFIFTDLIAGFWFVFVSGILILVAMPFIGNKQSASANVKEINENVALTVFALIGILMGQLYEISPESLRALIKSMVGSVSADEGKILADLKNTASTLVGLSIFIPVFIYFSIRTFEGWIERYAEFLTCKSHVRRRFIWTFLARNISWQNVAILLLFFGSIMILSWLLKLI